MAWVDVVLGRGDVTAPATETTEPPVTNACTSPLSVAVGMATGTAMNTPTAPITT